MLEIDPRRVLALILGGGRPYEFHLEHRAVDDRTVRFIAELTGINPVELGVDVDEN